MGGLIFHPEAFEELRLAPQYYYDNDLTEIGDSLVAELERATDEIEAHPHRWKKVFQNIHVYGPTRKFKWRIVYVVRDSSIFVIAAYYSGAEDPFYWIERLAS
jgi:hypothetical protein